MGFRALKNVPVMPPPTTIALSVAGAMLGWLVIGKIFAEQLILFNHSITKDRCRDELSEATLRLGFFIKSTNSMFDDYLIFASLRFKISALDSSTAHFVCLELIMPQEPPRLTLRQLIGLLTSLAARAFGIHLSRLTSSGINYLTAQSFSSLTPTYSTLEI